MGQPHIFCRRQFDPENPMGNILISVMMAFPITNKHHIWDRVWSLMDHGRNLNIQFSLIQKDLGFVPRYDLKAGWEDTVREMRARKRFT